MTKEIPIANGQTAAHQTAAGLSFGFRHSLVIGASSFVVHGLTLGLRGYQLTLSPALTFLFGGTTGCRFTPTCSAYAAEALQEHGAMAGTVLATKRICRCHPWGGCGHDPVPRKEFGIGNSEFGK